jgi:hypothetical protein
MEVELDLRGAVNTIVPLPSALDGNDNEVERIGWGGKELDKAIRGVAVEQVWKTAAVHFVVTRWCLHEQGMDRVSVEGLEVEGSEGESLFIVVDLDQCGWRRWQLLRGLKDGEGSSNVLMYFG